MTAPLKVNYPVRETLIEKLIVMGLPLLPADEANKEVVRLTVEIFKLQAQIDAMKMKEGEDEC